MSFQACLNAGMVHSGRVGVRYNTGSNKGNSSSAASNASSSQNASISNGGGDHNSTLNDSLPLYGAEELPEDVDDGEEEEAEVVCPDLAESSRATSAASAAAALASASTGKDALQQFTNECLATEIQILHSR